LKSVGRWAGAVLLGAAGLSAFHSAAAQPGRFAYVLYCDASLDKVDTATGAVVRRVNVAALAPSTAKAAKPGTMDGCVAEGMVFAREQATMYVLTATSARADAGGRKSYRLLSFRLPGVTLAGDVAAGEGLKEAPSIMADGLGGAKVVRDAPAQRATADWSGYEVLETSANVALVRVPAGDLTRLELAVGRDEGTKTLVPLRDLPETTALNVHLAPGGGEVMVEERLGSAKTGRIVVYDAATGERVKTVAAEAVKTFGFVGLAPDGAAIYRRGEEYRVVKLGFAGKNVTVERPAAEAAAMLFFADR